MRQKRGKKSGGAAAQRKPFLEGCGIEMRDSFREIGRERIGSGKAHDGAADMKTGFFVRFGQHGIRHACAREEIRHVFVIGDFRFGRRRGLFEGGRRLCGGIAERSCSEDEDTGFIAAFPEVVGWQGGVFGEAENVEMGQSRLMDESVDERISFCGRDRKGESCPDGSFEKDGDAIAKHLCGIAVSGGGAGEGSKTDSMDGGIENAA